MSMDDWEEKYKEKYGETWDEFYSKVLSDIVEYLNIHNPENLESYEDN